MEVLKIKGYEVITNSDLTEGRGVSKTVGYASNYKVAKEMAKGKGVMGTDADIKKVDKEIVIYDTIEEYQTSLDNKIIAKALSKLTKEEIKALKLENFK